MQINIENASYAFKIKRPRVPLHSIKGQDLKTRVCLSQRPYMLIKRSTGPEAYWAQIAKEKPPKLGAEPLRFAILFFILFLFQLLFFLLILVIELFL